MKGLLRRTLVRRVVAALLLAIGLAWIAVAAYMYADVRVSMRPNSGLHMVGRALHTALLNMDSGDLAGAVVRANGEVFNSLRLQSGTLPGSLLYQLRDSQGVLVYASPELADLLLEGEADQVVERSILGTDYWLYRGQSMHWTLWIAEPRVKTPLILGWIGKSLAMPFLIALPFLLIPVWIAVTQGLKPLRELAARIAKRSPHDLSPLGVAPRHAELAPLVGAMEGLLAQLRSSAQRERAFVHDAAHELRTPLGVISAQAYVLMRSTQAVDQQQAAHHLQHAINRAAHLVQQLLELASLDVTRQHAVQSCDVASVARSLLAQAALAASAKHIDLELDAPDQLLFGLDQQLLETVLRNLLDNAVKYVDPGGQVTVSLKRLRAQLLLSVADNGPGIAPTDRDRVFERFYRGSGAHEQTGTGLGLAIVQRACEQMGGSVLLDSNADGQGCQFRVTIPQQSAH